MKLGPLAIGKVTLVVSAATIQLANPTNRQKQMVSGKGFYI